MKKWRVATGLTCVLDLERGHPIGSPSTVHFANRLLHPSTAQQHPGCSFSNPAPPLAGSEVCHAPDGLPWFEKEKS